MHAELYPNNVARLTNMNPKISGIILAAGLSTRIGEPKQLLPFESSTIIESVIDNLLGSKFDEVVVVIGHEAERIRSHIQNKPVKIVFNPDYRNGMLTSAQCGVRSISDSADAFALTLVDQPFITSNLINLVVDTHAETDRGITLPSYDNRRGHPVIFDRRYAADILALQPENGGVRSLFRKYAHDIHYVVVDTDRVIRDIDYRKDYLDAINEARSCR